MTTKLPPTDFFVFRHGETEWNWQGRMQGHEDSPLTPRGQAQAEQIAARLTRLQPHVLACSDLGRASQTAAVAAQILGLDPLIHPGLRERRLGIFEGLTLAECEERHPREYAAWRSHDPAYAMPGGESVLERTARVLAALQELASRFPSRRIAVITHGGCLESLLRHTLHIPLEARRAYQLPNAAFNHFSTFDGRWSLLTWGDLSHLTEV